MIRGGIARKFVKRTLSELDSHFQDLKRQAISEGISLQKANIRALESLGDEKTIMQEILSRPELKSWSYRFPKTVYLAGPLFLYLSCLLIFVLGPLVAVTILQHSLEIDFVAYDSWLYFLDVATHYIVYYAVTPLIAICFYLAARTRTVHLLWPTVGIILISFIGPAFWFNLDFLPVVQEIADSSETEPLPTLHIGWGYTFLYGPATAVPTGSWNLLCFKKATVTLLLTGAIAYFYPPVSATEGK